MLLNDLRANQALILPGLPNGRTRAEHQLPWKEQDRATTELRGKRQEPEEHCVGWA